MDIKLPDLNHYKLFFISVPYSVASATFFKVNIDI